jgi:excinuclease ABC subunit A
MKSIQLWGVKQNNLKNIDVDIPLGSFTVVCGPSGSGKSSLAFETLYAEGQRRYIESLSNYARQFLGKAPKPDIEGIRNIPPAIAIEQKNSVKTSRSTVGTTTEIIDYLRLLFEKIGQTRCPTYDFPIERESVTDATQKALAQFSGKRGYVLTPVYRALRSATGDKLHQLLVAEGFLRIYIPAKKAEVQTPSADGPLDRPDDGARPPCRPADATRELGTIIELKPNLTPAKTTKATKDSKESKSKNSNSKKAAKPTSEIPDEDFYIVIDRLAFSQDDEGRLADSLGQAYSAAIKFNSGINGGRATVLTTDGQELLFSEENSCAVCGFTFAPVTSQLFSFNNPIGACPTCSGFGNILTLDEDKIVPNSNLSITDGALHPFTMPSAAEEKQALLAFCKKKGVNVRTPWRLLTKADRTAVWKGDGTKRGGFFGVAGFFDYLETKKYKMHVRVFLSRYKSPLPCSSCNGTRLKIDASYVKINGRTIGELTQQTVGELSSFVNSLKLTTAQTEVSGEILSQVRSRLKFLLDVGVEYLTLDRATRTLSGGEFQRLNLAKQLGMGLSQTLYVLDEPTVGLHPRDNDRLISILKQLRDLGNTLVVVEHDHDVIANSTHIIEMGPGSGHLGGSVIYSGTTTAFYDSKESVTVPYLRAPSGVARGVSKAKRTVDIKSNKFCISLEGCTGHNLKNLDIKIPLNRLVTITGVSGSGKSTLISQTLYPALAAALDVEHVRGQPFDRLEGTSLIGSVLFVDQGPTGKTARSSPVTYLKVYDAIRSILAATPESKLRGYNIGTFSLNVDGGRCPVCKGLGFELIDMMFMDDVKLTCDACNGKKFRKEVLEVTYKGKNIFEILNLTVAEAMDFFVAYPKIRKPLTILKDVGLDYICLGQSAGSLSGGESQRLKIAREFLTAGQKATLYILDEPTTGLHFREVEMLLRVLDKLVDAGNSVILIEHNLEIIRNSDYIIDLGPEAGAQGGTIVAQGSPKDIEKVAASLTGQYLAAYNNGKNGSGGESDQNENTKSSVTSRTTKSDLNLTVQQSQPAQPAKARSKS